MAITVRLYSFTKRENSTKRPSSGGTDYSCTLLDDTSLMNPTFKLSISSNPIGKNYCYVPSFNRYYFVTDISSYQNFWYISCTCDVLATYKTQIGSQSHYILRSASDYDGDIEDTVYPCNTNLSMYYDGPDSTDPLHYYSGECFVLGIVGNTNQVDCQFGSVLYYIMSAACLSKFLDYLMNNVASGTDPWGGILTTEYSEGVQKALLNPIQYIKSCTFMPFTAEEITTQSTSTVKFGYYSWSVPGGYTCKMLRESTICKTKDYSLITLRKHPQAATRGAYLNCQPYTRYTLHYGPWGDIDLDPMMLKDSNKLRLETLYDLVGGVGRLIVTGNLSTAGVIYNGSVKIGVDVNLSQVYKDALAYEKATTQTLFGSIAAGAGVGIGGNPIGDIASGLGFITSGIQDMTRLNYPTVSGVGSGGSYLSFHDSANLYLISKFNEIVDENNEELGRPLCQTKQISTLSGYILCDKADAMITGTQDEAIKVNGYLNSGFFYE